MGGQAHRGVAQLFQVADEIVNDRFTGAGSVQDARFDLAVDVEALAQVGQHADLHQVFHLARHARQRDDDVAFFLDDEDRGGADRVLDGGGAFGDIGLALVVLGGLAAKAAEALLDLLPQLGAVFGLDAHGQGHGLAGGVVYRWAKPAGGDDDIAAFQRLLDGLGNAFGVVADGGFAIQVNPGIAQLAGQVAGIGIYDLAQQDFGSDGDNFCRWHRFSGQTTLYS